LLRSVELSRILVEIKKKRNRRLSNLSMFLLRDKDSITLLLN
jgi:hypothetical protein